MSLFARRSGRKMRWGLLVIPVVLTAFGIAAIEIALRWTIGPTPLRPGGITIRIAFGAPCMHVSGSGANRRLSANPGVETAADQSIPFAKREGVTRIALVGESSAEFVGHALRTAVASASCGDRCEVLSCGLNGGAIQTVEARFDEVLEYQPDVVLVIFAHNFRYRGPKSPPLTRALLDFIVAHNVTRQLLQLRVVSTLAEGLAQVTEDEPTEAELVQPDESEASSEEWDQRRTTARLARMVRKAEERGVKVVLSTMASNLLLPPARPQDAPLDDLLTQARWMAATDGRAAALRWLASAPPTAEREFQLGAWLLREGEAVKAREHLLNASQLDRMTPRAPASLNEAIRTLAKEHQLPLLDMERELSKSARDAIPGWESFQDCCHLLPSEQSRMMHQLFEMAQKAASREACALPDSEQPSQMRYHYLHLCSDVEGRMGARREQSLAIEQGLLRDFQIDERAEADKQVRQVLEDDHFLLLPPSTRAGILNGVASAYRERGPGSAAWQFNDRAIAVEGNVEGWIQRTLWLVAEHREVEARAALLRAEELDKTRADVRFIRQQVEARIARAAPPNRPAAGGAEASP